MLQFCLGEATTSSRLVAGTVRSVVAGRLVVAVAVAVVTAAVLLGRCWDVGMYIGCMGRLDSKIKETKRM
jgi:hypothetical protein